MVEFIILVKITKTDNLLSIKFFTVPTMIMCIKYVCWQELLQTALFDSNP